MGTTVGAKMELKMLRKHKLFCLNVIKIKKKRFSNLKTSQHYIFYLKHDSVE